MGKIKTEKIKKDLAQIGMDLVLINMDIIKIKMILIPMMILKKMVINFIKVKQKMAKI